MWLLWVLIALLLVAAMSGGLALGLHLVAPQMNETKRILIASGVAAALPMSIAFGGFLSEVDTADSEFFLGFAALVTSFFMVLSICCLPPAWFTTTRLAKGGGNGPALPDAEEPQLIEG